MNIPFTKMHGLGNDFVIVEEDQLPGAVTHAELAKILCDRHFGIGADGLIVVAPPDDPNCAIQFKFYNADGSRAEMCGNGIRCFTRYVQDQGLVQQTEFSVETMAGVVVPHLNPDATVTVDMGRPFLAPEKIPFTGTDQGPVLNYPLEIEPHLTVPMAAIGMGNPHCILFTEELPQSLAPTVYGPVIEHHSLFPAKTNVEFCTVVNNHTIDVVVWERGVGPTLACGSGACAVAAAGILKEKVKSPVNIQLPGGTLHIQWDGRGHIFMTGPAAYVFAGMFPFARVGTAV